jgi:hypothetical protein
MATGLHSILMRNEGRHCAACRSATRSLVWARRGKPSVWLLLLLGSWLLVVIKTAEGNADAASHAPDAMDAGTQARSATNRHCPPVAGRQPIGTSGIFQDRLRRIA